jgi:hypothetical protein
MKRDEDEIKVQTLLDGLDPSELTALQHLAETMHQAQCNSDHTEQCSWGYETAPGYQAAGRPKGLWYGWAHSRWLLKAVDKCTEAEVSPVALSDFMDLYIKIFGGPRR